MAKKLFGFFIFISIAILVCLFGLYYFNREPVMPEPSVQGIPNVPDNSEDNTTDVEDSNGDNEEKNGEATYSADVYSVHLCDGYSDGTFSIRNIKLGMTFRQVVNYELKNIGVYVENDAYDKNTFYAMSSEDGQGKDLLPVKERALLGNACEIVYNFSNDITIEEPAEYPYLESVQFHFLKKEGGMDADKKIEKAFSDCFGKPTIETEGEYSVSVFTGAKEKIKMFYEYREDKESFNLRYILWEKFEE